MSGAHRKFEPTDAMIAELPDTSDREMARRYGTGHGVWRRIRLKHGIGRFREPTTINGMPNTWAEPKPRKLQVSLPPSELSFWRAPNPLRDYSLCGEAASFLRRERFHVYNRKIAGKDGWQVGRSVLSDSEMVAKAVRMGFVQEGWMG